MKNWIYGLCVALMTTSGALFAQSDDVAPPDQGFWQTLVMLGIFIAFFYVIMWRPEQKRRKALESQRSSLKKGDRVIAMGILGTVSRVEDQSVIVKMYGGTEIEFLKGAITDVVPESDESGKNESAKKESGKKVENISDKED